MTRTTARIGALACALLVAAAIPARGQAPRLEPTSAGVRWHGAGLDGPPRPAGSPLAAWRAVALDSSLAASAVRVALADSLAARGDTTGADSLLSGPVLARSLWAWEAVRRRAAWAGARGESARAIRLLEAADRSGWPAADEAAWRVTQAGLLLGARDTLGAEALARSVLETQAGVAPASGTALALLDSLARARGEPFAPRLARRAALAEWANGARARALARLAAVARGAPEDERGADQVQRVQWLREWRKPLAALAASDTALEWTRGTPGHDPARLERARAMRDAGRSADALVLYERIARTATEARHRELAWWECGREAQDESRWAVALRAFRAADSVARAERLERAGAQSSGTLAGLMEWTLGRHDDAIRAWRAEDDRRARFWLGVALRQRGEAEGDSILRAEFADQPGYDFYCAAARDTLGRPGWPGLALAVSPDTLEPRLVEAVTALSGPLALPDAAARIVAARDRRDPRLRSLGTRGIAATSWRGIAAAAYAAGDLAAGTRAADRALLAAPADSEAWAWVPWAFPPAFEAELARAAEQAGVEPALLWALARQESRFDPRAVSRSNALGLTQLLPGTARDVARGLLESLPADTLLFEPARSLRYGARYLRRLLDRFDGNLPVALTAYNAGPGKVRADWRELLARGGWALYCEMAANADTQDYVRRILAYRQAYRELRPAGAIGP